MNYKEFYNKYRQMRKDIEEYRKECLENGKGDLPQNMIRHPSLYYLAHIEYEENEIEAHYLEHNSCRPYEGDTSWYITIDELYHNNRIAKLKRILEL